MQEKPPQELTTLSSSPSASTAQNSFEFNDQRRNTLANCCPEAAAKNSKLENLKKEFLQQQAEKSTSLGKSEQKSLLNIFMKISGSQTNLNSLEELSQNLNQLESEPEVLPNKLANCNLSKLERQFSVNTQLRHRLFKRIKKSINESEINKPKVSVLQNNQKSEPVSKRAQKRRNPRDLWIFAVRQQILLIQMNKKNSQNEGTKMSVCDCADRIEYQAIPRLQSPDHLKKMTATWDCLIQSYNAKKHSFKNIDNEIYKSICNGVPKSRKGVVWQFVAQYQRNKRLAAGFSINNSNQKQVEPRKKYRSLLKELTVQQHAIFVDLGRTFPGVTFFAETMGFGQLSLFNLLKAYSLYDKEVEYCQGLSFVAGILLLHVSQLLWLGIYSFLMMYVFYLANRWTKTMRLIYFAMFSTIAVCVNNTNLTWRHCR